MHLTPCSVKEVKPVPETLFKPFPDIISNLQIGYTVSQTMLRNETLTLKTIHTWNIEMVKLKGYPHNLGKYHKICGELRTIVEKEI